MEKKVLIIFAYFSLVFLWTACTEKKIKLGKDIGFDKEENIHYGKSSDQIMDLYIPNIKTIKEKDIFIIMHGGGWRSGNET